MSDEEDIQSYASNGDDNEDDNIRDEYNEEFRGVEGGISSLSSVSRFGDEDIGDYEIHTNRQTLRQDDDNKYESSMDDVAKVTIGSIAAAAVVGTLFYMINKQYPMFLQDIQRFTNRLFSSDTRSSSSSKLTPHIKSPSGSPVKMKPRFVLPPIRKRNPLLSSARSNKGTNQIKPLTATELLLGRSRSSTNVQPLTTHSTPPAPPIPSRLPDSDVRSLSSSSSPSPSIARSPKLKTQNDDNKRFVSESKEEYVGGTKTKSAVGTCPGCDGSKRGKSFPPKRLPAKSDEKEELKHEDDGIITDKQYEDDPHKKMIYLSPCSIPSKITHYLGPKKDLVPLTSRSMECAWTLLPVRRQKQREDYEKKEEEAEDNDRDDEDEEIFYVLRSVALNMNMFSDTPFTFTSQKINSMDAPIECIWRIEHAHLSSSSSVIRLQSASTETYLVHPNSEYDEKEEGTTNRDWCITEFASDSFVGKQINICAKNELGGDAFYYKSQECIMFHPIIDESEWITQEQEFVETLNVFSRMTHRLVYIQVHPLPIIVEKEEDTINHGLE